MMKVRAKVRCTGLTGGEHSLATEPNPLRTFTFEALYDPDVPEDQRYFRYTPTGKLTLTVDNPAIDWELGKSYYLDIVAVEDARSDEQDATA